MTNKFKIYDFILRLYKIIYDHIKHITYVALISIIQIALVLWYLNFRKPSDSLSNIERGITDLTNGQTYTNKNIDDIHQQLITMVKKDSTMDEQLKHYPATLPLAMTDLTRASSVYSERIDPISGDKRFHWGVDYPAKVGTPVYATASGKVEKADLNGGYGEMVRINHLNGYESLYAHLSFIEVMVGQDINRGDLIGKVGNSGRTTGPHLHYEITYMERHINPNVFRTPLKDINGQPISTLSEYESLFALLYL